MSSPKPPSPQPIDYSLNPLPSNASTINIRPEMIFGPGGGGKPMFQRRFSKKQNRWITKVNETPQQKQIRKSYKQMFNRNINRLNSPNAMPGFDKEADAFYQRSVTPLRDQYNRTRQAAIQNAGVRGVKDSAGFSKFLADELEGTYQKGLIKAGQDKEIYKQDLEDRQRSRWLQELGVGQAGLQPYMYNPQLSYGIGQNFSSLGQSAAAQQAQQALAAYAQQANNQLAFQNLQNQQYQMQSQRTPWWQALLGQGMQAAMLAL